MTSITLGVGVNNYGLPKKALQVETIPWIAAHATRPSEALIIKMDTFIKGMKAAGLWNLFDVLYTPRAAGDINAAPANLKNPPAFYATATGTGSPAFVQGQGFTGSGANAMDTGFSPASFLGQYQQDNASMWVWCNTNVAENAADCGAAVTHNAFIRARSAGDAISVTLNGATTTTAAMTNSIGLTGISRTGAVNQTIWKNGVSQGASAGASTGLPAATMRFCGRGTDLFSTKQIALFGCAADLGGRELTFYNLVNALFS